MRRVSRRFKRHFGISTKQMTVQPRRNWFLQLLRAGVFMLMGYLVAYWTLTGGSFTSLSNETLHMSHDNQKLVEKAAQAERQLLVARTAQTTLAKELADMQDESMRLKEDVAFYKNVLSENTTTSELKLYSFKVVKGNQPGHYEYHILLVQSGRHDKPAQGQLTLALNATQAGQPVKLPLTDGASAVPAIKVNFKYYQRIDGSFVVPGDVDASTLELAFINANTSQASKLANQKVDLPT